jgi:MFS superfamily sulfate permease-like transporter
MKKKECWMDEKVKNLDALDIKLIKWCTVAFTLFIITVWPWLADLVFSVHWLIWLVIAIILMMRPMIKYFSK